MRLSARTKTLVWGTEAWTLSARPDFPSFAADGPRSGAPLSELIPDFPLLAKVIESKAALSVQVHPDVETAAETGGEPKTEAWCILEAGPIYAGLRPGVTPRDVAESVASGRFEELLVRHDARPFEVYFIPGGTVHAIGAGVKLYEIQQSSDTTYRLYDWGRKGADGRPRELHVEKALKSIRWDSPVPAPKAEAECPFFRIFQRDFPSGGTVRAPRDSFLSVYETATGASFLLDAGESLEVAPGRAILVSLPGRGGE